MRPYTLLMSLDQADGDLDFFMDVLYTFCINAKEQLAFLYCAACARDIVRLRYEAHSMKGGAATCCAMHLANSCGALERMARLEQDSISATTDKSAASSSPELVEYCPESAEYWKCMVDNIARCLDILLLSHNALASMRTLPFNTLKELCSDYSNHKIAGRLSSLLETAVDAYVAVHASMILEDEDCNLSEAPFSVARGQLSLAREAATALSGEDLVRTTEVLSDHLAQCCLSQSPRSAVSAYCGHRSLPQFLRSAGELKLDDMRVTVESLAAELALILGDSMPVLAVPFVDDVPEPVVKARSRRASLELSDSISPSTITLASVEGVGEPICDYNALMQNTGDDHKFVAALLNNFKNSLVIFDDGLADENGSLFDARSLHGAAVSMCAPRVVASLSDYIVATKAAQNSQAARSTDIANAPNANGNDADAVETSVRDFRAAVEQLIRDLHMLENGARASCTSPRKL